MSRIRNLFFLLLLIFLAVSLFNNVRDYQKNIQFYKNYKESSEAQEKRNIKLKTQKLLKTSTREIEKTIRNKLGLLRSNEVAIIIPLPSLIPPPPITPPPPVYRRWMHLLFNIDY